MRLRLGERDFGPDELIVMAIVNRTPDSFYDQGATFALSAALERIDQVVAEGADIVDIGGVKAGHGQPVSMGEEIDRTVSLVAAARRRHPDLVISVDTYRADVAEAVCEAGADLVNDTWAGADPDVAVVAARRGAGLVCSHVGGQAPRTDPHRVAYDDVIADVVAKTTALAERAVAVGVRRDGIVLDPTHDFGKNTWQSLQLSRRHGRTGRDRLARAGQHVPQGFRRRNLEHPGRGAAVRNSGGHGGRCLVGSARVPSA